jgi:hypothetical protein
MPIQIQGNGGTTAEVGGSTHKAMHVHVKPLEYGALGHYSFSVRLQSTAAQAANSRIIELRNTATNLIVLTRLRLRAVQFAAGTAQENSIDAYKCTGFTAVDTVNTATPILSTKKTTGMSAAPGGAALRVLIPATAGMTGGTLTKDTSPFATLPYNVAAAINTTTIWGPEDCVPQGVPFVEHPFVFAQNEGFIIENRVLNVTSYGIAWFVDLSYAEVASF